MEKKQSSIEWYANASHELIVKKSNGEITEREFLTMHHNLFYDAEAMHKEEILIAYSKALPITDGVFTAIDKAHDYYNETFGGYTGVIGVDNISWTNTNKLNNGGNNE